MILQICVQGGTRKASKMDAKIKKIKNVGACE